MLEIILYLLIGLSIGVVVYIFTSQRKPVSILSSYGRNSAKKPELKNNLKAALKEFFYNVKPFLRPISRLKFFEKYRQRLSAAGWSIGLEEFVAMKICLAAVALVIAPVFLPISKYPLLPIFALIVGFILPDMSISQKIKKRQNEISRDLPFILDLLNLCIESGMDIMFGINFLIGHFKKCPMRDELEKTWQEINVGKPRKEALKAMAWRINMPEISSVVRTLIRSEEMGTSMADALLMLSEDMRLRRFQRGEEMALKSPIKMLLPLMIMLSIVLVIVGAPIFLQFIGGGGLKVK